MKAQRSRLVFMRTGWLAGLVAVLLLGVVWPAILPSGLNLTHYYGNNQGPLLVILVAMLIGSPGAIVGGLVGSRIPREGGSTDQLVAAALMGIVLALPFGCLAMWYLTP